MAGATNTTLGTIKLAGDFIGSHAEAPSLRPSGVKAGTYNITDKVYVDAQGRITWAKQLPEDFAWPEGSKTEQGIVQIGLLPDPNNKSIDVDANSKISINLASASNAGVAKLGNGLTKNVSSGATDIVVPNASTSVFGFCRPDNTSMQVESDGTLHVDGQWVMNQAGPATTTTVGGVKVGDHFAIDGAGDLSTNIPTATSSVKGLASVGSNIQLAANTIDIPVATNTTYGTFVTRQPYFFIDDDFHTLYIHTCASPYFGNPEGLIGYVRGVSGASMSIDWPTSTISCSYNFDDFSATASTSVLGKVQVGDNIDVTDGTISLPDPTDTVYGPIKATGRSFKIDSDGRLFWDTNYWASTSFGGHVRPDGVTIKFSDVENAVISHDPADTPVATTTSKGIVQVGSGFNVSSGVLSVPDATTSTPGLVQVGSGLTLNNGEISLNDPGIASTSVYGTVLVNSASVNNSFFPGTTFWETFFINDSGTLSVKNCSSPSVPGVFRPTPESHIKATDDGVISYEPGDASTTNLGYATGDGTTVYVNSSSVMSVNVPTASSTVAGLFKIGSEPLWVDYTQGSTNYTLQVRIATTTQKGVVRCNLDKGFSLNNGVLSVAHASATEKGIMSPGAGLTISEDGNSVVSFDPAYAPLKLNQVNRFIKGQIEDVIESNLNTNTGSFYTDAITTGLFNLNIPANNTYQTVNYKITGSGLPTASGFVNLVYKVKFLNGAPVIINLNTMKHDASGVATLTQIGSIGAGCVEGDTVFVTACAVPDNGSSTTMTNSFVIVSSRIFKGV